MPRKALPALKTCGCWCKTLNSSHSCNVLPNWNNYWHWVLVSKLWVGIRLSRPICFHNPAPYLWDQFHPGQDGGITSTCVHFHCRFFCCRRGWASCCFPGVLSQGLFVLLNTQTQIAPSCWFIKMSTCSTSSFLSSTTTAGTEVNTS